MHILFVADGDSKYGAPNSLFQLVNALKQIKSTIYISVVLTKKSDWVDAYERIGCDVYKIPYIPFYQGVSRDKWKLPIKYVLRGISYWYGRLFGIRYLEKKLDLCTVNLIHSNSSREDFGALIAKKYLKPHIWHIREFGDLDYTCYSYRKNYISFMNEYTTEFIAISQAVQKHWISKGLLPEKFVQIYNGVRLNDELKKEYPKQGDILRFIMMGSLSETKGQHHAIMAITLLDSEIRQKIQIDIVGDGSTSYTKVLKHLIKTNGLSKQVHLLGYRKDFYSHLKEYDCGLMCSRCEGFGRVTVEYMMAGLPVIASDTGANPEIVEDNVNGLLYKYNDQYELAKKISYLVNDVNKINSLGKKAYTTAVKKYSAIINATEVLQEYYKVLNKL